ncbi:hypothetical protein QZH41_017541, partial [Actinostola sp. cb2023]
SLQDINLRKAFKSTIVTDQQVLSSNTLPTAMQERYLTCNEPPRLREMNPYRDDNKDALKFYTDPTYFFELWCEGMKKETEKYKKRKKHQRVRTGTRAKAPVKAIKKRTYCSQGEEFKNLHLNALSSTQSLEKRQTETIPENTPEAKQNGGIPDGVDHIAPTLQSQSPASPGSKRALRRDTQNVNRPTSAPPPPPPGTKAASIANHGHPAGAPPALPLPAGVPAPPPPPPPPMLGQGPRQSASSESVGMPLPGMQLPTVSPSTTSLTTSESSSSVVSEAAPMPSEEVDTRSDLLSAIRQGMALKRTQVQEKKKGKEDSNAVMDVASILARRIAVEYSSSEESETGSEWEDDDG